MVQMQGLVCFLAALTLGRALVQEHFTTPDVFPSPNATGTGGWEDALELAKEFVAQLNLTEKANMVTGTVRGSCIGNIISIDRLNFTGLCMQDGPQAIRVADLASLFPSGVTAAAAWDKNLFYQRGFALGEEFRDKGSHVLLGPVAGPLGRHPLGGRNWEEFSPDPYLTGVAMNETIRGIQDAGAQACAKHFIGNEQETQRSNTVLPDGTNVEGISSNIDDRTMHELYLWPFADAVRAGVASVMCSYNRLNQTYACENSKLLNGLLKGELRFQGYVVSDWMATHSGVKAIEAGLDMNMPGPIAPETDPLGSSYFGGNITAAVQNGSLPESRLDDMIARVLTPYYFLKQQPDTYPSVDPTTYSVLEATYGLLQTTLGIPPARDVRRDHAQLIREIGAAGTVLLKNVNNTLPLSKPLNIGVFGNDAAPVSSGLSFRGTGGVEERPLGFDVGTLTIGGGSGAARAPYVVSPLEAIQKRGEAYGARVQYITDNELLARDDFVSLYPTPDVCLVFAKTWAKESADRPSFALDWDARAVVANVAARCPNTVVVTHSAGVNTLLPAGAGNENVTAVLAAHYPGQESGNAIVDVLFGDAEPSGRLPYTVPRQEADYGFPVVNLTGEAARDSANWQADFEEGLFIDYRSFERRNVTPLYEFGFGLGYTEWEIVAPLVVEWQKEGLEPFPASSTEGTVTPGGDGELWEDVLGLKTSVRNAGGRVGSGVVQLYTEFPEAGVPAGTPTSILRGFDKVLLRPGEDTEVSMVLLRRDVSFWNVTAQKWQVPGGEIIFRVGFSSRDLKQEVGVELLSLAG